MVRQSETRIAQRRIRELFYLAIEDEKRGEYRRAERKMELISLYSQKYKARLIPEAKVWLCKKCKKGIYSNGGHIRINNSHLTVFCGSCGYIRRIPISRRSSLQ
jgi:RNase P subunit RPR2